MPAENADAAPKTVKVAIKKADTNETEWAMDVAPELLHEALVMRDMLGDNLDDIEPGFELPLPGDKVKPEVLELCLEYLRMFKEEPMTVIPKPYNQMTLGEMVQKNYNDFIYKLHYLVLFKLVDTANYLGIKPLVDLCLARIAFTLKSEPIEQFKKRFRYTNDLTAEEEALFREEYVKMKKAPGANGNNPASTSA